MSHNSPQPRLIVYDGDCPVCTATAERLRKRTWTTRHEVVAFQELAPDQAERMRGEGIDRQMLIADPNGEVVGGYDALLAIEVASGHGLRAAILRLPGLSQLGALAYRLFAANRRLLSPVPRDLKCACDPVPVWWERGLLWLGLLLPIVVLGWQFDWTSRPGFLALCGAWMVPALLAPFFGAGLLRTIGQLLVAMGLAAAVGLGVWWVAGFLGTWIPAIGGRQPILTLAAMWWVGGVQLPDRLKTIGAPRLEWVWMGLTLAVLLVASATWCPLR